MGRKIASESQGKKRCLPCFPFGSIILLSRWESMEIILKYKYLYRLYIMQSKDFYNM